MTSDCFSMKQRVAINRVWIALRFSLVSDLILQGHNAAEIFHEEGIEDVGSVSEFH